MLLMLELMLEWAFELMLVCADVEGCDAFPQICSPIAEISISFPQLEHFIVGRKLAGRIPPELKVAASDIL